MTLTCNNTLTECGASDTMTVATLMKPHTLTKSKLVRRDQV